jgi:hypothetical protein
MKQKKPRSGRSRSEPDIVLLGDLAPREDVKGGKGRLLFGEKSQRLNKGPRDQGTKSERKPHK